MKRVFHGLAAVCWRASCVAYAQEHRSNAQPLHDAPAEGGGSGNHAADDLNRREQITRRSHTRPTHFPIRPPKEESWSFAGPFGTYDKGQLQRGLKVYKEVCSACHSMNLVPFRTLERTWLFGSAGARRSRPSTRCRMDPNDDGEMFDRPGIPSDYFPSPFPNPAAAAAANGGAAPPDMSLLAKARGVTRGFPTVRHRHLHAVCAKAGPDYIHSLLTGYDETPPAGMEIAEGTHYNPYFINGKSLAMAKPLSDGQVTYDDGSPQTVDQYARDISAFLMWTAEPHLETASRPASASSCS